MWGIYVRANSFFDGFVTHSPTISSKNLHLVNCASFCSKIVVMLVTMLKEVGFDKFSLSYSGIKKVRKKEKRKKIAADLAALKTLQ